VTRLTLFDRAIPAWLFLTVRGAAVPVVDILVIALFARVQDPIATGIDANRWVVDPHTVGADEAWIDDTSSAAGIIDVVCVITLFDTFLQTITANFEGTCGATSVSAIVVPVVALFCLI